MESNGEASPTGGAPGPPEMSNNGGALSPLIDGLIGLGEIDIFPGGEIDDYWTQMQIPNDESLPLPEDPNSTVKLEFQESKYYDSEHVNGNHWNVKRDRPIPIVINSSHMHQSYLVGLVHTAPGIEKRQVVSKIDQVGPAFNTDTGMMKVLSTSTHGSNIHVMKTEKKTFNLNFSTEGSHSINEGNRKDNRIWNLFVLPLKPQIEINGVFTTNESDFKDCLERGRRIQVVAELRTSDKDRATLKWLKRKGYEFSPEDEEIQMNILKKCSKK